MIASKIFTHVSPLNIMIMNEKIVDRILEKKQNHT